VAAKNNGTRTTKRHRRTKEEINVLDAELQRIVANFCPVTVRQVFYQAVNRGLVPKSESKGYRVVQRRLCVLREVRCILHGHIVDGTRYVHGHPRHRSLDEFTAYAAGSYRRDYWADSPVRVEVWLEKDALTGVLRPTVIDECGLNLYVTRGFASVSYLQEAAEEIEHDGRPTYVYVLTDFDPSGISIAEKVEEELIGRAPSSDITVERLAVNREQIDRWQLPTRPTKSDDSRAKGFLQVHGTESVELDARPPDALRRLVKEAIERHMNPWKLQQLRLIEERERDDFMKAFADTYERSGEGS
jgi:hypothetical protein